MITGLARLATTARQAILNRLLSVSLSFFVSLSLFFLWGATEALRRRLASVDFIMA